LFPVNGKPEAIAKTKALLTEARAGVGAATVTTNVAGAELSLDGAPVGRAPLEDELFAEPGHHTVQAKAPGFAPVTKPFDAAPGATVTISFDLHADLSAPVRRVSPAWLVAGAIVAVGGIGVGVGELVSANGRAGDVDAARTRLGANPSACAAPTAGSTCATLQSAASSRDSASNIALAAFLAGGVVGLGTFGVWLFDRPHADATHAVHVVPSVGGLSLVGAW
jgi:hypothetical protein